MKDRMPAFTPWPDRTIARPNSLQRKAWFYHGFHDTPDADCISCAWEHYI